MTAYKRDLLGEQRVFKVFSRKSTPGKNKM